MINIRNCMFVNNHYVAIAISKLLVMYYMHTLLNCIGSLLKAFTFEDENYHILNHVGNLKKFKVLAIKIIEY